MISAMVSVNNAMSWLHIHHKSIACFNCVIACCTVDISVYHGGFHSDLNETMFVGKVDERSRKLVQTAYECMMAGIRMGTSLDILAPVSLLDFDICMCHLCD